MLKVSYAELWGKSCHEYVSILAQKGGILTGQYVGIATDFRGAVMGKPR